ncbi:Hypothetical predicted protein [Cloeon dipterum]|uniref:Uncharacterized protein n=1 Tax=Cloeon dipterum TaxID=197152 RepID=A0A8S1DVC1_9INSE|nr:Hypothetical predicted protein [Cloeon dipterum]
MKARKLFLILNFLTIYSVSARAQDEGVLSLTIEANVSQNVITSSHIVYLTHGEQRIEYCYQNNTREATILTCGAGVSNISNSLIPQKVTVFINYSNKSVECFNKSPNSQKGKDDESLIKRHGMCGAGTIAIKDV